MTKNVKQMTSGLKDFEKVGSVRGMQRLIYFKWPCIALTLLLLILGALRPLALPDEGRYAEIGRWMGVSGDWLAPRLNGLPFFHKPPLLYWLEALVTQTLGPSAWFVRLIPGFHAVIVLVIIGPLLNKVLGNSVALRSVIIFGTSAAFLLGGQYINHDMMVACWISVAIASFGCFVIQSQSCASPDKPYVVSQSRTLKHTAWIGFAACALGVLSKGLIGAVLPGWVIFLWLCWSGRWSVLKALPWGSGLFIFTCITLPWFLLTERAYPGMLDYMFGVHQFERFTGTHFNNSQPFWFYALAISLLLGPWVIWFWAYQIRRIYELSVLSRQLGLKASGKLLLSQFKHSQQCQRTDQELVVSLCIIWVWAIVIFFSIPQSKIIGYVLPVTPPMAVLCALGWERLMKNARFEKRIWQSLIALSVVIVVIINDQATKMTRHHFSEDIAKVLRCQDLKNAQVMVAGEYPYDLPFLALLKRPMWVVQDWEFERANAGDGWKRELFEGANFESVNTDLLKPLNTLELEYGHADRWLVTPSNWSGLALLDRLGYTLVSSGSAWNLYRTPSTIVNPVGTSESCF